MYVKNMNRYQKFSRIVISNKTIADTNLGIQKGPILSKQSLL